MGPPGRRADGTWRGSGRLGERHPSCVYSIRAPNTSPGRRLARRALGLDAAEEVALVAHTARQLLLSVHCAGLRREDLKDCYS